MKYSIAAVFFALVALAAAAPVAVSDPGDTAPVMSNGETTVPFANTGNPGNAMDAADAAK
ncbi:hypothetical protein SLS56_008328 [Neofusicoccum ribis]|uniref:Uncharacterized protein n=1 Tax=Neofusicoccum ribis TaxID=45134 RepID=A0ABR3SKF5_9PEZI